jgi:hypothetical protein
VGGAARNPPEPYTIQTFFPLVVYCNFVKGGDVLRGEHTHAFSSPNTPVVCNVYACVCVCAVCVWCVRVCGGHAAYHISTCALGSQS